MARPDALLVIDVQMAFVARRDAGYPWGNPEADQRIADSAQVLADIAA